MRTALRLRACPSSCSMHTCLAFVKRKVDSPASLTDILSRNGRRLRFFEVCDLPKGPFVISTQPIRSMRSPRSDPSPRLWKGEAEASVTKSHIAGGKLAFGHHPVARCATPPESGGELLTDPLTVMWRRCNAGSTLWSITPSADVV